MCGYRLLRSFLSPIPSLPFPSKLKKSNKKEKEKKKEKRKVTQRDTCISKTRFHSSTFYFWKVTPFVHYQTILPWAWTFCFRFMQDIPTFLHGKRNSKHNFCSYLGSAVPPHVKNARWRDDFSPSLKSTKCRSLGS